MRIKNAKVFVREIMKGDHTTPFLLETINREYSPEIRPVFFEELFTKIRHVYLDLLLDLSDEDILMIIEEFKQIYGYLPVISLNFEDFLKFKHFIRKVGGYTIVSNVIMDYEYVFDIGVEPIYLDKIVKAVWDNFSLFNSLSIQVKYKGFEKLIELESTIITLYPDLPKQIHKASFTQPEKIENHSFGGFGEKSEEYRMRISEKARATKHTVKMAKMMRDNTMKVGDEIFIIPLPVTKSEAFERLIKLHGQSVFESLVSAFEKKFEANDPVPVFSELKKIDEFISKANKLDIDRAFAGKDVLHEEGEYLRLKHGYYKKDRVIFKQGCSELGFFGRHAPEVFGRYFLFKDWLTERLKKCMPGTQESPRPVQTKIRKLISTFLSGEYSIADSLSLIEKEYPKESILNVFKGEFKDEIESLFNEILLNLTDNDLVSIADYYETISELKIPILRIDRVQRLKVKHFIREFEGRKFVSNVQGLINSENYEVELINLNEALKQEFSGLCFWSKLSVFEKYHNFPLLWKIDEHLNEGLSDTVRYSHSPTQDISKTKEMVQERINGMHPKGWKYAFRSAKDYQCFTDLLTKHFELRDYSLPEQPISLKQGCKTRFAIVLRELHHELKDNVLKNDKQYFDLIRVLSPYANEENLYRVLIR